MNSGLERDRWDRKAIGRKPDERVLEAFAGAKIDFLEKHISGLDSLKTLEVGCGDGFISRYLSAKTNLVGLDISPEMLAKNPLDKKIAGSAYALPFADGSFDLVVSSNILHHLDHPQKAVAEIKRVTRRFVFLSEPNAQSPPVFLAHFLEKDERRCLAYRRAYLEALCLVADLKIVDSTNAGRVTPRKTPPWLVGLLQVLEKLLPGGFFSMVLADKR